MTVQTMIRDWLLLVGNQYGVREAHPDRRPADQCKTRAPFFVYRFTDSETRPYVATNLTVASGTHDAVIDHSKTFTRTLEIECHTPMRPDLAGEIDGMRVLEAIQVSIHNPAVHEILISESGNLMTVRDSLPISNDTAVTEQSMYRMFTLQMTVDINTNFALLREDARVDSYSISGELIADSGNILPVTAEGDTT